MASSLIGIVSDTHGLVRPQALNALQGVDLIIHAGDIGASAVIEELRSLAPLVAIRGNVDRGHWATAFPATEVVSVADKLIYIIHDLAELELDPTAAGFHVVVSGHSHRPSITTRDRVLFVNPGSIGPRRFKLPISLALLRVSGPQVDARIVELPV